MILFTHTHITLSWRTHLHSLRQVLVLLLLFSLSVPLVAADKPTRLAWSDLLPADFDEQAFLQQLDISQYQLDDPELYNEEVQRLNTDMFALFSQAPVVDRFTGKLVQLPGFIVPLEMDEDRVLSFLLVPYFGACIHTPPPPANQIVYVETLRGFELSNMNQAMMVEGLFKDDHVVSELGHAGYRLLASSITPYTAFW